MQHNRRNVLKAGAATAAALMLPRTASADARKDGASLDLGTHLLHEALIDFYESRSFRLVFGKPVVAEEQAFNGGLRYDETGVLDQPGTLAIQPCARIEDIERKHDRTVLPLFHMFCCMKKPGMDPAASLAEALEFLVKASGLDSRHLAFVSTEQIAPLNPVLAEYGLDSSAQVHIRDRNTALNAGDGSGFFRFPGNDNARPFATIGLYCWIGAGPVETMASYPPKPGWLEIGEVVIDENEDLAFAFGTERLGFARSGEIVSWQDRLLLLFEQVDRKTLGRTPPPGRDIFSKT
ncbi:twin-arginine translocation signal domain-containing protein [Hoeflea prorocentri]|uniref:Twin-arginine translocation signal domain-containing protein n=1 Tax=Hoeflea prorocentri TaxID=1922333 RepID=A0A9X3ZGQ3_9HYPH|nr:twin-arginine translocation signal domain-containing protein [Hoeflea prorocentri]MCY6380128.1 twin-arginine translocation signal domain-containing protein [Hoeflea prorocentri]MDA5397928.1 twin-arginine translocation signal domain-containing protein [Hoeflea prorocentri]